jgi:DNA-binding transcriptional MocR family regulator
VTPGRPWFPAEPAGPFLRLSFAGAQAPDLERGAALLGTAVERMRA